MCERDLRWVHSARNHDTIRAASGSDKRISFRDHRIWFDCSDFVDKLVFTEDEKAKGVILYDRRSNYWGFYLRPSVNPHAGLGRVMLSLTLLWLKREGVKVIKAEVKRENYGSRGLHESLGFKLAGATELAIEYEKEIKDGNA